MKPLLILCLGAALAASAAAQPMEKSSVRAGSYDVPIEVAKPAGAGPFPPLLYIHAKRGFDDVDRAHMRELAAQGFLFLLQLLALHLQ